MLLKIDSFLPDDEKALARLTWMIAQSYSDGKELLIIITTSYAAVYILIYILFNS